MLIRDTIHILSHPKAGRTWLRLLLSLYFQQHFGLDVPTESWLEVQQFHSLDERIPQVLFTHDSNSHLKPLEETRDKSVYKDNKVIYLVRDPRDVIVSNYFQQNRREPVLGDAPAFPGTIKEYIRHPQWGIAHDIGLMNIWAVSRDVPRGFFLLRYEDMMTNITSAMRQTLHFIGIESISAQALESAIRECSFENMHRMEAEDLLNSGRLRPTDPDDPESFKVRRGVVGGYVDYLDEDDIDYVDQEMKKLDTYYGYISSTHNRNA